jgi:hypothetical protein
VEGAIMQRQNCLLLFSTASRKQAYATSQAWMGLLPPAGTSSNTPRPTSPPPCGGRVHPRAWQIAVVHEQQQQQWWVGATRCYEEGNTWIMAWYGFANPKNPWTMRCGCGLLDYYADLCEGIICTRAMANLGF